jgi:hypothetical protein
MTFVETQNEIDINSDINTQTSQLQWFIQNPPRRPIRTWISPGLAAFICSKTKNPRNRPKKDSTINMILENGYEFIAGMIIFGKDGNLIDGQNRLFACVEADEPIEIFVTFGWDPEIFKMVDSGKIRRGEDLLHAEGVDNPKEVANAVRWIMHITTAWDSISGTIKRPTKPAFKVLEYYRKNIEGRTIQMAVEMASKIRRDIDPIYTVPVIYLAYLAGKSDKAGRFVDDIYFEKKRSRAWHLVEDFRDNTKNHRRVENIVKVAWIIQVLNGEPIDGGWTQKKPFPTIK